MGTRGPLKKLKVIDGKFQPPTNTPKPAPAIPRCPAWLSGPARAEWRRVARPLYDLGLLTPLDRQALAQYCAAVGRIVEAEKALKNGMSYSTESGREYLKPEYRILQDAVKEVRAHCTMFGLSPSARMRMELPEPQETDELTELLD